MTLLEFERRKRGWQQGHLADLVGVTSQAICAFERGKLRPSPTTARRLAELFTVPATTLFMAVDAVGLLDVDAEEAVR